MVDLIPLGFALSCLCWILVLLHKSILLNTRRLARIEAQLNSIIFVQSGQLNGASGPEILAKMEAMGKRFEEELKFLEIAEKARPSWWRRALVRTPRINNKGEENDSGGTAV